MTAASVSPVVEVRRPDVSWVRLGVTAWRTGSTCGGGPGHMAAHGLAADELWRSPTAAPPGRPCTRSRTISCSRERFRADSRSRRDHILSLRARHRAGWRMLGMKGRHARRRPSSHALHGTCASWAGAAGRVWAQAPAAGAAAGKVSTLIGTGHRDRAPRWPRPRSLKLADDVLRPSATGARRRR